MPKAHSIAVSLALAMLAAAPAQEPTAPPTSPPTPAPDFVPDSVRLDVLMVSLPEDLALPLLPDLRNPQKIEAAQARILELIALKKATFIDWPQITTVPGERADSENHVGETYSVPEDIGGSPPRTLPHKPGPWLISGNHIAPPEFDTRDTGTRLQATLLEFAVGKFAQFEIWTEVVRFLRDRKFPAGAYPKVGFVSLVQPIFQTLRVDTTLNLHDGERKLLYVAKPIDPGSPVTLFIIGAKFISTAQPSATHP